MLINELAPTYDAIERHATLVEASPQVTYQAVKKTNFARSGLVVALLAARAIPTLFGGRVAAPRELTVGSLQRFGFVVLAEIENEEIVLGLIGRFWSPTGQIRRVSPPEFIDFDEPGFAKAYWSFRVEPISGSGSRLHTETRVVCTSEEARRSFLRYFRVVRPFSGLIRVLMLRRVKEFAESR